MSLDGAFLSAIARELECLVGSRVDKVNQPSRDEIIMSFRSRGGLKRLLISANAMSARIHLTEWQPDNPKTPPMFCLLMRKYFCGAKLMEISQDGLERIITLSFDATSELGDPIKLKLVSEIMGRHSNLIILSENGKVIDSIKRVNEDVSRERIIIPGILYEAPPRRERLSIHSFDNAKLAQSLAENGDKELSKAIIESFEGLSPIAAREFAFFATRGAEVYARDCVDKCFERLCFITTESAARIRAGNLHFSIVEDKNGALKDFTFMQVSQYGAMMVTKEVGGASETLEKFFVERDKSARRKQRGEDLFNILANQTDKLRRKMIMQREEIVQCAEKETYKLYGDLISANIYRMKSGEREAMLENYYDNMAQVKIPLDIRLTPAQNAQKYYSVYRKKCTAEKMLETQIKLAENETEYLESVFDMLTRADTLDDIETIRDELYETGYIKKNSNKGKKIKQNPPIEFMSSDGFTIYVGRNNKQNDALTLRQAGKQDIWLHTHNIPGAHVIIETRGQEMPERTLLEAAKIAAFHSKAGSSAQVPVDYCLVKFVKKPAGAKPGMVIFTNNKTLYVEPSLPEVQNEA